MAAASVAVPLQSAKSVPSSQQNKARRRPVEASDTAKSRDGSARRRPEATKDAAKPARRPGRQQQQPTPPRKVAPPKPAAKKKKKKKPKDAERRQSSATIQEPVRRVIKPDDQLDLNEKELEEDVPRVLTGDDPNRSNNVCKFSFKDKCYKPDPPGQGDNMAVHFSLEGCSMHVDSDECRRYREREAKLREMGETDGKVTADAQTTAASAGVGVATASAAAASAVDSSKNQFNFSERASQTFNNPLKSRGVHTEPPPVTQYSDDVSQWKIHDSYKSEFLLTQSIDKLEGGARTISFEDKLASIVLKDEPSGDAQTDTIHSESMDSALKTVERLVNHNAEDEVFQDFKYYEDQADDIKRGQGTLLPLWKFSTERANRKQVTSVCWNPRYNDLFAVAYGSYDFMRQGSGMVCCFSLKNTSYP
ncbi:hypothetical protein ACHAXT_006747 [Thalassiosira profunda]